jgi:hypothetical protein
MKGFHMEEQSLNKSVKQSGNNPLCEKCLRTCKQPAGTLLISCPRYLPRPFKVKVHRFAQLDLFGERD